MKKQQDFLKGTTLEESAVSREIRLFCCNMFCSGTAMNLSPDSMFILTDKCIPSGSSFEVLFRVNNELLKTSVRVREVMKKDDYKYGIEVKVLNGNQKYMELVV